MCIRDSPYANGPVHIGHLAGCYLPADIYAVSYTHLDVYKRQITQFGNYLLHNIAGADGNSVMDTCYATQKTTETMSFAVLGKPSAIFNDQVKLGCVKDTIVVSHPGGNGINLSLIHILL